MSSKNDDGHHPSTCNWRECKAVSDVPCPFMQDKRTTEAPNGCPHEWRYFAMFEYTACFHCVHCLALEVKDLEKL